VRTPIGHNESCVERLVVRDYRAYNGHSESG